MKDKTLGRAKKELVHTNISNEILGQPNSKESVALADFREQKGETIVQNNVRESGVERFPHHVPEESSITSPHEEPQELQQKQ